MKRNDTPLAPGLSEAEWRAHDQEVVFYIDLRARTLRDGRTVVRARFGPAAVPHSTAYEIGDATQRATVSGVLRKLADAIDAEELRRAQIEAARERGRKALGWKDGAR